ncbi:hypothetical protein [Pelobium manganitolerans]|uniref:hypothetical protein n=1 Tax=Pelobium manganitolerans TaxID=1842495 RepID=UPI003FA347C4
MKEKNSILLLGLALFLGGLFTFLKGALFDIPTSPNPSQRINIPGIILLLLGIVLLFFSIKNRKNI